MNKLHDFEHYANMIEVQMAIVCHAISLSELLNPRIGNKANNRCLFHLTLIKNIAIFANKEATL